MISVSSSQPNTIYIASQLDMTSRPLCKQQPPSAIIYKSTSITFLSNIFDGTTQKPIQLIVRLSVHLSVRLSVSPSVHPFVYSSVRPSVHPSVRPSVRSSIHPSIRPSVHTTVRPAIRPFIRPSVHPFVRPSVRLSVRPSVRPSVHPSVRPSVHRSVRLRIESTFLVKYTEEDLHIAVACFDRAYIHRLTHTCEPTCKHATFVRS